MAWLSFFLSLTPIESRVCLKHFCQFQSSFIKKYFSKIEYVILDFTAIVKTGKHFEQLTSVYDSRDGKIHKGFPLLQALGIAKDRLEFPLLWKFFSYEKEFLSENLTIVAMLETGKQVSEDDIKFFLKEYFKRTKIETSFKNEKQDFGLENFRVLNWKAMTRMVDLIMLAKTVSEIVIRRNSRWLKMVILYLMNFVVVADPKKKRFTINNVRKLKDYILHFGLIDKYTVFLAKFQDSG